MTKLNEDNSRLKKRRERVREKKHTNSKDLPDEATGVGQRGVAPVYRRLPGQVNDDIPDEIVEHVTRALLWSISFVLNKGSQIIATSRIAHPYKST